MPHVKFFGATVGRLIDDNFDSPERRKSIAKKAEKGIVLSRTGWKIELLPQAEGGRIIDRQVIG